MCMRQDAKAKGAEAEAAWNETFAAYAAKYPAEAGELKRRLSGELPADFAAKRMPTLQK